MRTSSAFPASWRQATQVLTGRCFSIGLARLDVYPEAGQLGREPRVLPVPADGQRELRAGHEDRRRACDAVDRDPVGLGGPEGGGDELFGIFRPRHDVDMLVGELAE